MKNRDETQKEECTVNPVFLFQRGFIKIYPDSPLEYNHDLECITKNGKPVSYDKILEDGYGWIEWQTEHVWLNREEAEKWGENHSYRYAKNGKKGRKGHEWQVYCVPCCGDLATILNHPNIELLIPDDCGRYD